MTKNIIYNMHYIDGGGNEWKGGLWDKKETERTLTFEIARKPGVFAPNFKKIVINKNKPSKHAYRKWEDGSYTVYPNRSGVPHIFKPYEVSNQPYIL